MKENTFHVGIKDPIELRKNLLESSRDIIKSLQKHERFKAIREEKIEQIIKLKNVMGDIEKLNKRFKAELPKIELRAKKEEISKKYKKTKPFRNISEVEKLEKELDFIEAARLRDELYALQEILKKKE